MVNLNTFIATLDFERMDEFPGRKYDKSYIPGECNLGKKEINRRKLQSIAGLFISIIYIIILEVNGFDSKWRLILFAPVFYTTICFFQAREKFCVVFGVNGVYNFNEERKFIKVEEEEFRLKDRNKSSKILFMSLAIAILITVIYFYLPV